MLPGDLKAEQFAGYPPESRALIVAHLAALRQLPLSFVPSLLREAVDYDFKFPAERSAIGSELAAITSLSSAQLKEWFLAFAEFSLSPALERLDWVNQPASFVEQLSAYLWTTHQLDGFRKAATDYGDRLRAAVPPEPIPVRRLGIAVIGQGVASYDGPLFRNLRKHGTYFAKVNPDHGLDALLLAAAVRAKSHPIPYGHWYVDGGQAVEHSPLLTCVSYQGLEPVRAALLRKMQADIQQPGMGPEQLRTNLARITPSELGMDEKDKPISPILERFQVRLFTEGSGTQIFSTTFAQWTTREALRRAQPLTLLVRFAPRQEQKPMNEMLSSNHSNPELDLKGSLIDADMAAYYHWVNQQRLPGAEQAAFIVWFEGNGQALAIGPSMARGADSHSAVDMGQLLAWVTG